MPHAIISECITSCGSQRRLMFHFNERLITQKHLCRANNLNEGGMTRVEDFFPHVPARCRRNFEREKIWILAIGRSTPMGTRFRYPLDFNNFWNYIGVCGSNRQLHVAFSIKSSALRVTNAVECPFQQRNGTSEQKTCTWDLTTIELVVHVKSEWLKEFLHKNSLFWI